MTKAGEPGPDVILEIRSEYFHGEWPETPPPVLIGERTAGSSMLTRECEDPFAPPDAENAVDSALVADRAKKLERGIVRPIHRPHPRCHPGQPAAVLVAPGKFVTAKARFRSEHSRSEWPGGRRAGRPQSTGRVRMILSLRHLQKTRPEARFS